jgi:hypothetical protein
MRVALWPVLVLVAIGACTADGGAGDSGPGDAESGNPAPPAPSLVIPARVRDEVVAAAAAQAGVDPADVIVLSAEARTWGDSSLGCPQPGMSYTQATVDGYQVVVSAGGSTYDYRVGAGSTRLCENAAS